jgi:hypothetical protein
MSSRATAENHALPGGPADHAVFAAKEREEVQVEVVSQEGVVHPGIPDALLRGVVVPGQREGGVRGCAVEGRVHDVLHARVGCGVHKGVMLLHPVLRFGGGHHEQHLHPLQGLPRSSGVRIVAHHGPGVLQLRRAAGVADQQALGGTGRGELPCHHSAQAAGGTGDSEVRQVQGVSHQES